MHLVNGCGGGETMKGLGRLLRCLLVLLIVIGTAGCHRMPSGEPGSREIPLRFQGRGNTHLVLEDRVLVVSEQNTLYGEKRMVTCFDRSGKPLWYRRFDSRQLYHMVPLADGSVVVEPEPGTLVALDSDGRTVWEQELPFFRWSDVCFAAGDGLLAFGVEENPSVPERLDILAVYIDSGGAISEAARYPGGAFTSVRGAVPLPSGGFLLHGAGDIEDGPLAGDTEFIACIRADFTVDWVYHVAKNEYVVNGDVLCTDTGFVFAGVYMADGTSVTEKGFVRELDAGGKEVHTQWYDQELPGPLLPLPGGGAAVALTSRDWENESQLRKYDKTWTETGRAELDFTAGELTMLDNGDLAVSGYRERLPERPDFSSTVRETNAVFDRVVERITGELQRVWQKSYDAESGISGWDFFAFPSDLGDVYIET